MFSLQEAYESIINNEELMKDIKFIDIKFFVEPKLEQGLSIEDISSKYDDDIYYKFLDIFAIIENIAEGINRLDNYLSCELRRDKLHYFNFYDIDGKEVIVRLRFEDAIFMENSEKSGIDATWSHKYTEIDGLKFYTFEDTFNYLNKVLANETLDMNKMWWD